MPTVDRNPFQRFFDSDRDGTITGTLGRAFGVPGAIERQGGARGRVMERLSQLKGEGLQGPELLSKMLGEPAFTDAFTSDPDIGGLVRDMVGDLMPAPPLAGGPGTVYRDPNDPTQVIAQNPFAPEGGGGLTANTRELLELSDLAGYGPEQVEQLAQLSLAAKTASKTGDLTEFERARERAVSAGEDPALIDNIRLGLLEVTPVTNAYGQTIGTVVTDHRNQNGPPTSTLIPPEGTQQQAPQGQGQTSSGVGGDVMTRAKAGIAGVETVDQTDPYRARGPVVASGDRAYGKYQVMGKNIPSWTKDALGKSMTARQFLLDPDAQERVFEHRFGGYLRKYGNAQDAASVWFTGRPLAKARADGAKDVNIGVDEYIKRFNQGFGGKQTTQAVDDTGDVDMNDDTQAIPDIVDVGDILDDPTDMYLGTGFGPAITETVGGITGNVDPNLSAEALGGYATKRQAVRNAQYAVIGLRRSGRLLKAEQDQLQKLAPSTSPFTNPVDEIAKSVELLDYLATLRANALGVDQDMTQPVEVRKAAREDVVAIDQIYAALPSKAQLEARLDALKRGEGGQMTIQDLIGKAQEVLTGTQQAVGENGTAAQGSRIGQIKKADVKALNALVNSADPPLTLDELKAALQRLDELGG